MIAAKEALMLGGVAIVAYLAFKPDGEEGFGGAGGEGVEKKEPSEAGDVIYNIPEPVDYSGFLQEILGGQPTMEEIFPETDPYRAPIDYETEKKLIDEKSTLTDDFIRWGKGFLEDPKTSIIEARVGKAGGLDDPMTEFYRDAFGFGKRVLTTDYLKTHNIFGKEIDPEEEKDVLEKKQVGLTLGKVLSPEPYVYKTKETGIAGIARTVSRYGEQRPGYLATGAYERMSGAFQVLGPTHPGSKYYEQVGYKKGVKSSAGRLQRVAAWKAKHGEPKYTVTHRVKA